MPFFTIFAPSRSIILSFQRIKPSHPSKSRQLAFIMAIPGQRAPITCVYPFHYPNYPFVQNSMSMTEFQVPVHCPLRNISWRLRIFGGVLKWGYPWIIHFNKMFHSKSSSYWGTPMTTETPISEPWFTPSSIKTGCCCPATVPNVPTSDLSRKCWRWGRLMNTVHLSI